MSIPHILLVDDSEAILAYEQAALSQLYALSTAANGVEALEKARAVRPDGIVLDLSMPQMNGTELLAVLKADPLLRDVPVIIVSSEAKRARACLDGGATAFLEKPIRADNLRVAVARALEEAQEKQRRGSLAVLMLGVGSLELGIPLENVVHVLHQVPTRRLPFGPPYLREMFDFGPRPVCVLDMAMALGLRHAEPLQNRKLVVVAQSNVLIALCVDTVRDPEEFRAAEVVRRAELGGAEHGALPRILSAVVRRGTESIPIVDPAVLLSADLLLELSNLRVAASEPSRDARTMAATTTAETIGGGATTTAAGVA